MLNPNDQGQTTRIAVVIALLASLAINLVAAYLLIAGHTTWGRAFGLINITGALVSIGCLTTVLLTEPGD